MAEEKKSLIEHARVAGFHARSIAWSAISGRPLDYSFKKRKAIETGEYQHFPSPDGINFLFTGSQMLPVIISHSATFTLVQTGILTAPWLFAGVGLPLLVIVARFWDSFPTGRKPSRLETKMNHRAKKIHQKKLNARRQQARLFFE